MTDPITSKSAYDAIADIIARRIRTGEYEGPSLPTEHQLADEFGVSRVTVNRALLELAQQGLIEVRRGNGWFLLDPVEVASAALAAFLRTHLGGGNVLLLRDPRGGIRRVRVTDLED